MSIQCMIFEFSKSEDDKNFENSLVLKKQSFKLCTLEAKESEWLSMGVPQFSSLRCHLTKTQSLIFCLPLKLEWQRSYLGSYIANA